MRGLVKPVEGPSEIPLDPVTFKVKAAKVYLRMVMALLGGPLVPAGGGGGIARRAFALAQQGRDIVLRCRITLLRYGQPNHHRFGQLAPVIGSLSCGIVGIGGHRR